MDVGRELIIRMRPTGSLDESSSNIIGVSINTGKAMVGYVDVEERAEFDVLGDMVNVAYQLLNYSRPYRIIAGSETIAALGENYRHKFIGGIILPGRECSVDIHEILPS